MTEELRDTIIQLFTGKIQQHERALKMYEASYGHAAHSKRFDQQTVAEKKRLESLLNDFTSQNPIINFLDPVDAWRKTTDDLRKSVLCPWNTRTRQRSKPQQASETKDALNEKERLYYLRAALFEASPERREKLISKITDVDTGREFIVILVYPRKPQRGAETDNTITADVLRDRIKRYGVPQSIYIDWGTSPSKLPHQSETADVIKCPDGLLEKIRKAVREAFGEAIDDSLKGGEQLRY